MRSNNWQRHFNSSERGVLEAFLKALPNEFRLKVLRQLAAVGCVQRQAQGGEVNLYSRRFFRPVPLDCVPISGMPPELLAATLHPTAPHQLSVSASIWFVAGHIFSLEFDREMPTDGIVAWNCELAGDITPFVNEKIAPPAEGLFPPV